MQNQFSQIYDTLNKISAGIGSLSQKDKKKFTSGSIDDKLYSTLGALGGVVSAENAAKKVSDSQGKVSSSGSGNTLLDAYTKLRTQNQSLQEELKTAQKAKQVAESDASLSEQLKQRAELGYQTGTAKTEDTTQTDTTGKQEQKATGIEFKQAEPTTPEEQLAFDINEQLQANVDERIRNATAQMDELKSLVDMSDDDTASLVQEIESSRQVAIKRQADENQRLARAARVAGITTGRAMYSPEEHEGIISNVIQEGNNLLTEINIKAASEKRKARESQRDFNYKAFVKSTEILDNLSQLKTDTVIEMAKQIRQAESDARERMKFDQEQDSRNATILAQELVNADAQTIRDTADANGIEYGLLLGAVRDAKSTVPQRSTSLTSGKKLTSAQLKEFESTHGWTLPNGATAEVGNYINETYPDLDPDQKNLKALEIVFGEMPISIDKDIELAVEKIPGIAVKGDKFMISNDSNLFREFVKLSKDIQSEEILPFLRGTFYKSRESEIKGMLESETGQLAIQAAIQSGLENREEIANFVIEKIRDKISAQRGFEESINTSAEGTAVSTPAIAKQKVEI